MKGDSDIETLFASTEGEQPPVDAERELAELFDLDTGDDEERVEPDEPLPSRWWTGDWS